MQLFLWQVHFVTSILNCKQRNSQKDMKISKQFIAYLNVQSYVCSTTTTAINTRKHKKVLLQKIIGK